MIHQLTLLYSAAVGMFDFNPYVYLVFAFVATLIASMLSFKYFEQPMNKWVKRKLQRI
ncbi:hypothetical protein [Deinococcus marmoris]|uniref:hypothetical protein n=1 Tax=Deinococcus marmoris TaxID=249408 RepID=UPI0012DF331E|nr:hypothetical protein [Deinococcus marmoris]